MPQFTRAFRALSRLFPGSAGWNGPSFVPDAVFLTEPLFRASIGHDVRLLSSFLSQAIAAGVNLDHPEPPPGYIHVPVVWSASYDGSANVGVDGVLLPTANAPDSWGRFVATARVYASVSTSQGAAGVPKFVCLPTFPYTRGTQLRTTFVNTVALTNISSLLLYLEMPAELADIQGWPCRFGNFAHTRALD